HWSATTYNTLGPTGAADEYYGTLTLASANTYAMSFRFSNDEGATYCYAAPGTLTVVAPALEELRVQSTAALYAVVGLPTEYVYPQVEIPGVTGRVVTPTGIVDLWLGRGPVGTNPSTWTAANWVAAVRNPFASAGAFDEYYASLQSSAAGTFDVA